MDQGNGLDAWRHSNVHVEFASLKQGDTTTLLQERGR